MTATHFARRRVAGAIALLLTASAIAVVFGSGLPAGAAGPGSNVIETVDSAGDTGLYTSLQLDAAGNPVIAYHDDTNGDLRLVHCTTPDCSGPQTPRTVDSAGDAGRFLSLHLDAAGNPVISYEGSGDLRLVHCTTPDCSGPQTPRTVDSAGVTGWYTSLQLDAAGNPVISYRDQSSDELRLVHCTTPDCSGPQTPRTVDIGGATTSLRLDAAGNPVISHAAILSETSSDLRLVHCTTPDCSGPQTPQIADSGGEGFGQWTSLQLDAAGNPVISYAGVTDEGSDLRLVHCTTSDCSGTQIPRIIDSGGITGLFTSLQLDAAGNPVISYQDRNKRDLKLLRWPAACSRYRGANLILGTSGADNLTGTPDRDVIVASDGDDNVRGRGGNDCILGGTGDDTLEGGAGNDRILGGDGNDSIEGDDGRDILQGGTGNDTINGGRNNDRISGNGGRDVLRGGNGRDRVNGQAGPDYVSGGGGNDRLLGGGGNDTVNGNVGTDFCGQFETIINCEASL